jgi:uncharacterized membrane protein YdbT with pleckstrin-like domain
LGFNVKDLLNGENIIAQSRAGSKIALLFYIILGGLLAIPTFGLSALYALYMLYTHFANQYTVTNKRIITNKGIFFTSSNDTPIKKIDGVDTKRNILNRLAKLLSLGILPEEGDVIIQTASGNAVLTQVVKPTFFQRSVQEQILLQD